MDFDDLHDLADDRPNDRPELSSPIARCRVVLLVCSVVQSLATHVAVAIRIFLQSSTPQ